MAKQKTGGPELVVSALGPEMMPADGRPEFAILGRSNAGKSSIINALVGHKVAYTGGTPGRTLRMNFFRMPGWYLVDLPGFGYAKVSKTLRQEFGQAVESYLTERQPLIGGLLIQDCRRDPQAEERMVERWSVERNVYLVVVANKSDKLNRAEFEDRKSRLEQAYRVPVIMASARTGTGLPQLKDAVMRLGLSL